MEANRLMRELYDIARRLDSVQLFNHAFPFNNTEMQLIKEILQAKEAGKKIISSRLAEALGITRSAVSQMVNKLEAKNGVKRVADDKDRKIAYLELSDSARTRYEDMKERINAILGSVIEELGNDKVETFVNSANEFVDAFDGAVARQTAGAGQD
mgnify:FL=1